MLARVRERLCDDVVGGSLDVGIEALLRERHDLDRDGRAFGEGADGMAEAVVCEDPRVEAPDELADLLERELQLGLGGVEQLGDHLRDGAEAIADQVQMQGDGDEPLLRSVVEVALDPAALGVPGRDDPRAGLAQVAYRLPQVGDVAYDHQHLARESRGDPQLEVAQLAEVGVEPVVHGRELAGRERSLDAGHQLRGDVGREQFADVRADDQLGWIREPREIAAELEVGAVRAEPEDQVGERIEQRAMSHLDRC